MSKFYTKDHEWIAKSEGQYRIGISRHAAKQLGDIVFVELPPVGAKFRTGQEMAVIESVKAASEVYAPISGKLVAVNEALAETPETIGTDPENSGWFVLIETLEALPETLMNESRYRDFCGSQ